MQVQPTGLTYTGILVNGSATSKFDIVFIGDGFQKSEQTAFNNKVNEAVAALQNRPGYSARMCGFNIWRVNVLSTDSGIDHPKNGISKNTALDCRYGNPAMSEAERCIVTDSPAKCFEAAANAPARDAVFVLVNDTQWGGCAGNVVCSSIAAGFDGLITHELAHDVASWLTNTTAMSATAATTIVPTAATTRRKSTSPTTPTARRPSGMTSFKRQPRFQLPPTRRPASWDCGKAAAITGAAIFRPQNFCHMRQTADPFCAVCARTLDGDLAIRCLAVLDVLKYRRFIWREPFRIPIPICLSCPRPPEGNLLDRVTLQLAGLPRDATVRIVDSQGNVVAEAQPSGDGFSVDFQSSRAERYFAELIPAQSMTPREVTLRTELFRNGEAQELPAIGQH